MSSCKRCNVGDYIYISWMLLNWGTGDTSPLSITIYLFKLMIILSNEIVWNSCDLDILKKHMENTSYH